MEPTQFVPPNMYGLRLCNIAAGAVCLALLSNFASATPAVAPDVNTHVHSNYGKLPLRYEVNQGQTDAQVKFLARRHGYAQLLTPTEAMLSLKKPQAQVKASSSSKFSPASEVIGAVLRMQLGGANTAPESFSAYRFDLMGARP